VAQHILFEEDGAFRAGTVLSATDASLQVELASGKRGKVKTSHVLLRYEQPAPAALLAQAQAAAAGIDLDFLWECAPQEEFGFEDLAREYAGHAPGAVEAAAILLRLHGAPVYFHRKGRGRYKPAPPEVLRAALAGVEKRRRQEELKQQYVEQLQAGQLPAAIAALGVQLAVAPDRNGIEYKAVEAAAAALQLAPLRLLLQTGAIASPYRWHLDSFLARYFPRGTGFAAGLPAPVVADDLPLAEVEAFSIDDSATTEIDDAFSLAANGDGSRRVGIHIAAPATAITRGTALDAVARERMSTVYAPGLKYTMLPAEWIAAFSLDAGRTLPVLSLYLDVDVTSCAVLRTETRLERVQIAANLRHDVLDEVVTPQAVERGHLDTPFGAELLFLHRLATSLLRQRETVRGRPEPLNRVDYGFVLDGEGETARISIKPRKRGAPLDLIVAELMIFANSQWGGALAQARVPAIYRSQSYERGVGRVRMSTTPAPHEGMGVAHYAWSSSPLRRYVDLLNQQQLLAQVQGMPPAYAANDAELFSAVSGFDALYGAYAEFQEKMERYWCLRWLQQEKITRIGATVVKFDLLRLDGLPMLLRLPGLPELPRGQKLELDVLGSDEVELVLHARLRQVLAAAAPEPVEEDEDDLVIEDAEPAPAVAPTAAAPAVPAA
jgi:exoribonuclease-2